MVKPIHIFIAFCVFVVLLLLFYPPQFLDENGERVIVRKPLPGPEWFWQMFQVIEQSKW